MDDRMREAIRDEVRTQLQAELRPGVKMPVEVRAHLSESIARIDEALKAGMQRTAF